MSEVREAVCGCGCGRPTPLAKSSRSDRGHVKGQPLPFLQGHGSRKRAEGGRAGWREREKRVRRERYAADPEFRAKRLEQTQRSREKNIERERERMRLITATRRARKRGVFIERVVRDVVLERDDGACGICGGDVDPFDFHVDHIVPLVRGGEHSYANVQAAHPACNQAKGGL